MPVNAMGSDPAAARAARPRLHAHWYRSPVDGRLALMWVQDPEPLPTAQSTEAPAISEHVHAI